MNRPGSRAVVVNPVGGRAGGSGLIAARSASIRSVGRAPRLRTWRALARGSQPASWA